MGPRNRIRPSLNSAAFEFACDFMERHFRIIAKLNDDPADFQFSFVRHEPSLVFRESERRIGETVIVRVRKSAFVRSEPNALTLQLIQHRLLRNAELLADLSGGKASFEVKLAVVGRVFPMALLEKLYRIQVRRSG